MSPARCSMLLLVAAGSAMAGSAMGGCAGAGRHLNGSREAELRLPAAEEPPRREDRAVALLGGSTECSGVLVASDWVLTAAHCVVGIDAAPDVRFASDDPSRVTFVAGVDSCELHPGAYPGTPGCYGPPAAEIHDQSDLALLHLARTVPIDVAEPVPVSLSAEHCPSLPGRRVRIVGWHRGAFDEPLPVRRAGWNEVVEEGRELFAAMPRAGLGISMWTRPGDSGGPALLEDGTHAVLLGILTGGVNAASADSVYVRTSWPENARWISSRLRGRD